MRRPLSAAVAYPAELVRRFAERWNSFWFTPADPTLLGVMRVCVGLMLLYTHAIWGLVLFDFFGPDGWISRDLVEVTQSRQTAYSFWWLVAPRWYWAAYAASMVVLLLFTAGVFTRVTSVLALAVVISFAYRVPEAIFGLDKLNSILTFYTALGPSGAAVSVDRWLARRRRGRDGASPRTVTSALANFTQRLIQVHMCIIYFFAGLSKFQGAAWWNGEAMWLALGNLEYQSADMTWLAWHPWVINFLTHFSAIWELSFCALIWVPLLRPLVLIGTVLLHLGIGACLGLWTFALVMIIGCMSFLPNEPVRALVEWLSLHSRRVENLGDRDRKIGA
jgi:Vitamin K-dependent gamma-carboxylase